MNIKKITIMMCSVLALSAGFSTAAFSAEFFATAHEKIHCEPQGIGFKCNWGK